jgi:hypothetical protein
MTHENTPFSGSAKWLWGAGAELPEPGSVAVAARFKRAFEAPPGTRLTVDVSADSHYLLWINGRRIGCGPAKGDPRHWPYDTFVLDGWLTAGANELTALAICFAPAWPDYERGGPPVACMTAAPGFILDGQLLDDTGTVLDDLATNGRWLAAPARDLRFARRPGISCAGPGEEANVGAAADDAFALSVELARGERPDTVADSCRPHRLIPRRIPFLEERPAQFESAWDATGFATDAAGPALLAGHWIEVDPHGSASLLLDAGTITTGYPQLDVDGTGIVRLAYDERLRRGQDIVRDPGQAHEPVTGPMFDVVNCRGGNVSWTPVFWRAFRFLQLDIQAGGKPLKVRLPGYTFTAYPYPELPLFQSSDPAHERMDEISWRTLRMCSHETFEDCPTRERLQYAGDVHVQARTAYWMAGDTALARQAMLHFAESVNDEGLTASRYPSRVPQLIPVWSLHWVLSVGEYYDYSGDRETVRACLPAMLRVLDWFRDRREPGGLVGWLPYWKIADWCPQWPNGGTPPGMECGPTALVNFMLVAALRAAAALGEAVGRADEAADWRMQADELATCAHHVFWDAAAGLYRDRPAAPSEISQLTNAWAILSEVASGEQARRLAEPMATRPSLCEAAWFGKNFIFDALMKAGRQHLAERLLEPFRALLPLGLTAWPESLSLNGCSECHGWANLPGLAFRRLYLGVRAEAPGCRRVRISPWPGALESAEGVVPLPQGLLKLSWRLENGRMTANLHVPPGVEAFLDLPGKDSRPLATGNCRVTADASEASLR